MLSAANSLNAKLIQDLTFRGVGYAFSIHVIRHFRICTSTFEFSDFLLINAPFISKNLATIHAEDNSYHFSIWWIGFSTFQFSTHGCGKNTFRITWVGIRMTSVLNLSGLNYQNGNPLRREILSMKAEIEGLRKEIATLKFFRPSTAGAAVAGPPGPAGPAGPQGPPGPKGDKGDKGDITYVMAAPTPAPSPAPAPAPAPAPDTA
jgi:hypothetical protein